MRPKQQRDLTHGSIAPLLLKLTWPMIFGMLGMVMFNLADTYFIGKVGVDELAAMGFTFPVVMVVGSLALGVGMGTSSLISRSVVSQPRNILRLYATEALLLGLSIIVIIVTVGQLTMNPLLKGFETGVLLALGWGMLLFIVAQFWGKPIASVFSDNPNVISITADYLYIVSFSYGFQGILIVGVNMFNGINKPIPSMGLTLLRMFGLYVPLAWLASVYWNLQGVFWAAFVANIITGVVTYRLLKNKIRGN
ncbi:MAG: hypothetical protein KGY70_10760 [Bacteroidales bacterium]|nr:hypothetical protein [Bacteroidales bacterium]